MNTGTVDSGLYFVVRVYRDESMVKVHIEFVKRSMFERLFSLPFLPFKKYRRVEYTIPRDEILRLPSGDFVCHPVIYDKLKAEFSDSIVSN